MSKKRVGPDGGQTVEAEKELVVVDNQNLLADRAERQVDWAAEICAAWQKTLDSILETGRLLIRAKDEMPYGAWQAMVASKLPFGPDTADRLIAIAKHPVLSDTARMRGICPRTG
jgi:hypothetical protein